MFPTTLQKNAKRGRKPQFVQGANIDFIKFLENNGTEFWLILGDSFLKSFA